MMTNIFEKNHSRPRISIGIPVYNGEATIAKAIESILCQTFRDFEVIISDNASSDKTQEICQEFADKDDRIKYVRQPLNIGAIKNFEFVYRESKGKYFMWAAADDTRTNDFLQNNHDFLENNHDYVASVSPVKFEDEFFNPINMGCFSLDMPSFTERLVSFYTGWHANARYYSLFRKDLLSGFNFSDCDILGGDWYLVLYLTSKGKLACIDQGALTLGRSGVSNTSNIFEPYNTGFLNFLFPFLDLFSKSSALLTSLSFRQRVVLYAKWARLSYHALKLNLIWKYKPRN